MNNRVAEASAEYRVEAFKNAVPVGYKQTEVGVIPEDWAVNTFEKICKVNQGLQIAIERRKKNPTARSKVYITVQLVNSDDAPEYIDDYSSAVCCEPNDVLMTRTGNTGMVITGQAGVFHNNFFKINFDTEKISSRFFVYYLRSHDCQKTILEKAGTSTIPDLNHGDFYSIKIAIPSFVEQTAIANALSDVDALISSLEKLINKKQAIKTASMQQLLTGKTRLPQFATHPDGKPKGSKQSELGEIPEDWEVVCLEELAIIAGGGTPSTNIPKYWNGTINWFTPTEVVGKKYATQSNRKLTLEGLQNCSARVLPVNTVLMTTRVSIGDLMILREEASTNQGFQSLIAKKNVDFEFLYYMMLTKKGALLQQASGSTFLEISPNKVKSIEVFCPPLEEQTTIATILSDMDTEIQTLEQRLSKTRHIKQGMMQELLTGKTRLVKPNASGARYAS